MGFLMSLLSVGKSLESVKLLSQQFFLSHGKVKKVLGKSAKVLERLIKYSNDFYKILRREDKRLEAFCYHHDCFLESWKGLQNS